MRYIVITSFLHSLFINQTQKTFDFVCNHVPLYSLCFSYQQPFNLSYSKTHSFGLTSAICNITQHHQFLDVSHLSIQFLRYLKGLEAFHIITNFDKYQLACRRKFMDKLISVLSFFISARCEMRKSIHYTAIELSSAQFRNHYVKCCIIRHQLINQ